MTTDMRSSGPIMSDLLSSHFHVIDARKFVAGNWFHWSLTLYTLSDTFRCGFRSRTRKSGYRKPLLEWSANHRKQRVGAILSTPRGISLTVARWQRKFSQEEHHKNLRGLRETLKCSSALYACHALYLFLLPALAQNWPVLAEVRRRTFGNSSATYW